jgi:hypothetical protein
MAAAAAILAILAMRGDARQFSFDATSRPTRSPDQGYTTTTRTKGSSVKCQAMSAGTNFARSIDAHASAGVLLGSSSS